MSLLLSWVATAVGACYEHQTVETTVNTIFRVACGLSHFEER